MMKNNLTKLASQIKESFIKGYLPEKLFEKAVNKKLNNDIRLVVQKYNADVRPHKGVMSHIKDFFKKDPKGITTTLEDRIDDLKLKLFSGGAGKQSIAYNPDSLNMRTYWQRAGRDSNFEDFIKSENAPVTLGPVIGQHELQELQYINKHLPLNDTVNAIPDFIPSMPIPDTPIAKGVSDLLKKYVPAQKGSMAGSAIAKSRIPTGRHRDPGVLLNESNKLFHEVSQDAKDMMTSMRKSTNEAEMLRRAGLRYGEEYIPEGGRRWNKLVKNLRKQSL